MDILDYRFGFSSSQLPNASINPPISEQSPLPRRTVSPSQASLRAQPYGHHHLLDRGDEYNVDDSPPLSPLSTSPLHIPEDQKNIRSKDAPQLGELLPGSNLSHVRENEISLRISSAVKPEKADLRSTSGFLDLAGHNLPTGSPPLQSASTQRMEKKFICGGELNTAPGMRWGCGRRYATTNSLSRHFRSEAGRACVKSLIDEERELMNSVSYINSACGIRAAESQKLRDASGLPQALI